MADLEINEEIVEIGEVGETNESKIAVSTIEKSSKHDEEVGEYIGYTFAIFTVIWTMLIAFNNLYSSLVAPILLLPYIIYGIGILNRDKIADDKIEENVFSTTFITMGLVFSIPLIGYINQKISESPGSTFNAKFLCHLVFLAMIMTLLSYLHVWVDESWRHVFKIVRSCFETIAVTLYILVLTYLFILT